MYGTSRAWNGIAPTGVRPDQQRGSVADFAHAARAVVVIVDRPARSRVKRRHVVHQKAVEVTASRQFEPDDPDAIHAFVHRMLGRRTSFGRPYDQRNLMRLGRIESEYSRLGERVIVPRHGGTNIRLAQYRDSG